jgi:predicted nucleic acid-binding protein
MPAAGRQPIALDSSVSVPLLVRTHDDHPIVEVWSRGRSLALTAHSLAESYSVLTRLPGDLRVAPETAARVLEDGFGSTLLLKPSTARKLASVLAEQGIAGGAVYDALVALAAADNGVPLATRDARARATYEALGVEVEIVR